MESAADRLETLAFDCIIQEQTEEFSVSCCSHRNTVSTLECAVGLTVGGALQVIVVAATNLKVKVAMSSDGFYRQLVAY